MRPTVARNGACRRCASRRRARRCDRRRRRRPRIPGRDRLGSHARHRRVACAGTTAAKGLTDRQRPADAVLRRRAERQPQPVAAQRAEREQGLKTGDAGAGDDDVERRVGVLMAISSSFRVLWSTGEKGRQVAAGQDPRRHAAAGLRDQDAACAKAAGESALYILMWRLTSR
jgi:hypothetical protein